MDVYVVHYTHSYLKTYVHIYIYALECVMRMKRARSSITSFEQQSQQHQQHHQRNGTGSLSWLVCGVVDCMCLPGVMMMIT